MKPEELNQHLETVILRRERKPVVLIVDDDLQDRQIAFDGLEHLGCSPVGAATGEEAIDYLFAKGGRIDAALVDLKLPAIDGVSVWKRIREQLPDVKTIIMSNYQEEHILHLCRGHGVVVILEKPATVVRLKAVLNTVGIKVKG